jgi:hypothetical protein
MFNELKQRMQRFERTAVYRAHVFTYQLACQFGMSPAIRSLPKYRNEAVRWERKTLANSIKQQRRN